MKTALRRLLKQSQALRDQSTSKWCTVKNCPHCAQRKNLSAAIDAFRRALDREDQKDSFGPCPGEYIRPTGQD